MQSLLVLLLCLIAGVVLAIGVLWLNQRRLIYFPMGSVPPVGALLPGAEEVAFVTEDGLTLVGWYLPPATGAARAPTVLVLNGNGGNRAHRAPLAAALARAGVGVLLFDYRGYGGNPGQPTEAGLLADARAARAYLLGRPDVAADRLVYLGESLGAAVALALVVEQPPAALVLRSPFTSLVAMARRSYPFLPVEWLVWDRYPSLDRVTRLTVPVLVVAGDADGVIPVAQSRAVYDAAPPPKRLVIVAGADHNDVALSDGPPLIDALVAFLAEHGVMT
jgi:fermentation-respiration switch protein FrsA (DUF1100 family)